MNESNDKSMQSNLRILYSQDSPLFAKSLNDITHEITQLSDFLRNLVFLMKKFTTDLRNTSKCCEALSIQMKEGFIGSGREKHRNLLPFLGFLGDVSSIIVASFTLSRLNPSTR